MAERYVLVTIAIDTAGNLCGRIEWTDDDGLECRVFRAPLEWGHGNGPSRTPACLALDGGEPGAGGGT